MIKFRKIIRSLINYVPGVKTLLRKKDTSPQNSKYYYDMYLSHIQLLRIFGFINKSGKIAEIGPGDT